jgi:hypothetical protein
MSWETPSYVEVNMSSEIGAYQDDFEERVPLPGDAALRETAQQPGRHLTGSEG